MSGVRLLSNLEQLVQWLRCRPGVAFTLQVKNNEIFAAFSACYPHDPKPHGTWARAGVPVDLPRALEQAIETAAGMLERAEHQELGATRR